MWCSRRSNDYAAACFKQYGLPTDDTGRYAAMYKPFHLIGLELSISVLNVALRGEPTGSCHGFRGDAVAVAKRALKAGEMLDGEGGYTVYAKLIPAERSLKLGALPIGLAHHVKLNRDVAAGAILSAADVALDEIRKPSASAATWSGNKAPRRCWPRNRPLLNPGPRPRRGCAAVQQSCLDRAGRSRIRWRWKNARRIFSPRPAARFAPSTPSVW